MADEARNSLLMLEMFYRVAKFLNHTFSTIYLRPAAKGKIALANSSDFQAQFDDLRLYSRKVLEIRQSLTTGRSP